MTPSLKNQLLISMPQLTAPPFHQTVSLICQHDEGGAIGVIVNRLSDHRMGDVFAQLSLPINSLESADAPVFEGGPLNPELGLVIHTAGGIKRQGECGGKAIESGAHADSVDSPWEASMEVGGGLWLTSSRDILRAMADGDGPPNAMLTLGYAAWGPGQLEFEMRQNAWFHAPADHALIFNPDITQKWEKAANLIGINFAQLSHHVGHA